MLPQNVSDIVKKLSKEEMKRLYDFVHSPYFNSRESLCLLYNEISKQYPDLEPAKFEHNRIYKKIFGNKDYKEQTIKNLYSEFGILLKKFIAHERICSNEVEFNTALINGLADKKCFEQSNKVILSGKKKIKFETEEINYFTLYQWETMLIDNYNHLKINDLDEYHVLYNSLINNLVSFFLGIFYYYAKEDFIITKAHKPRISIPSVKNAFIDSFNAEKFFAENKENPSSVFEKVLYLSYKYAATDMSYSQYKELENIIINNIDTFTTKFKYLQWGNLLELIIFKLVPKNKKHYDDAFKLNDYFIKLNLYPNELNTIGASLYRTIYGTAIMEKKYEWAGKFIEDYSPYLPEGLKQDEMNYGLGRVNFQMKNYEKSLDYLGKVTVQQALEKINVRFYYLMNYIELKSYTSAIAMLNAIRQYYIESKEIPEMFAILIEDSLKFFREIIRAEENNKKLDYAIYKEAQKAGRYYHKQYILEKMKLLVK